jgi:hypothetical protein
VASDKGAKAAAIFFRGQLARSQTGQYRVRQSDAGKNGVVATPFIGSGRRGGSRDGGREATDGEVGFNLIGFESVKERGVI